MLNTVHTFCVHIQCSRHARICSYFPHAKVRDKMDLLFIVDALVHKKCMIGLRANCG